MCRVDDWTEVTVEERALREGTRACVVGLIDDDERVVRPPFPFTRKRAWVFPGSPQSVVAGLRSDCGVGAGIAIVLLAMGVAAFLFPVSPLLGLACGTSLLFFLRRPGLVLSALSKARGLLRRH